MNVHGQPNYNCTVIVKQKHDSIFVKTAKEQS